jgi:integrase
LELAALAADIGTLRFHDLRHTCASLLIYAGADVKTVSEQLRHSSVTITLDTYGHTSTRSAGTRPWTSWMPCWPGNSI